MSWKRIKIGDFLQRIKRPIKLVESKSYKLVTIRINHKGIALRETKKGAEINSNMYEVKEGDFILSGIDARNGAFGIIPKELDSAVVTNDFWYFEIDESVIDKRLFLELTATTWFDELCKRGSDGTTQRIRLQKEKFFNQYISLPNDIMLQRALMSKITNIRIKQNKLETEISLQKEYLSKLRQSILQDAINGKLTKEWRENNPNFEPASELLKRIKAEKQKLIKEGKIRKEKSMEPIKEDEILFDIPESWVCCRLGDLCTKTGSGSTPKEGYSSQGVIFLRSQNVYNDGITLGGLVYISQKTHLSMSGTIVKSPDLLLNITGGSIGRCAIVPESIMEANINQHVSIIRLIDIKMNNYIHFIVISDYFQKMIIKAQTGAGREGLPKSKMDKILIPIPPQVEQTEIARIVKTLLSKVTELENRIIESEQNTQQLMKAVLGEFFENK